MIWKVLKHAPIHGSITTIKIGTISVTPNFPYTPLSFHSPTPLWHTSPSSSDNDWSDFWHSRLVCVFKSFVKWNHMVGTYFCLASSAQADSCCYVYLRLIPLYSGMVFHHLCLFLWVGVFFQCCLAISSRRKSGPWNSRGLLFMAAWLILVLAPSSEILEKGSDCPILGQILTSEPKDWVERHKEHGKAMRIFWMCLTCLQPTWEYPSDLLPCPTLQILTEIVKCLILGSIPNESNKRSKTEIQKRKLLYKFRVEKTF